MRVLIATHYLGISGGAETYLRAVLPELLAAGHDLAVLFERPASAGAATLVGDLSAVVRLPAAGRPVADILAGAREWAPDVVYTHGLLSAQLETALAETFPTALFAHGYYGTCIGGGKCFTRPRSQPCRRRFGAACLALYPIRGCGGRSPLTMVRDFSAARRRDRVLRAVRAVVVASRHMADEYTRHGVSPGRLRLVPLFPPGVRPDPSAPVPRPPTGRVLFVGRVSPTKGLHHLVEALPAAATKLSRRLTLVVAGDGPDRTAVESAAAASGVPAEFLGWVDAPRRETETRSADVLAVPSLWPEPFGLVGVEAGCLGLPAVGYSTGGIPDWLVPGVSGEAAPGECPDPAELADALVRALADDAHRHRLGVGAHAVAGRFTAARHLAELQRILAEVASGGKR